MKKGLYLILILIIFGLSYLKWQAWKNPIISVPTSSPTPSPITATPGHSSLTTPYFSLNYPDVATSSPAVESPDSTTWKIDSTSGNYSVAITRYPEVVGDDPSTTQAESDRQSTIDSCGNSSVTKLTTAEVAGQKAISFSGGCQGEANNYYFTVGTILYRITTIVVGAPEDTFGYQQTVNGILSSLKFIEN